MNLKIKIRLFFWTIFLFVLFSIFYRGLVPSGKIVYVTDFSKENSFISFLSPKTRIEKNEEGIKVIADPVYFSLHTPRKFNKAKLGIYYKSDNTPRPIIEAGVMVDKTIWRYKLEPLQNKIIDDLCLSWDKIRDGDLLFCQKKKNFSSINEFLASSTNFSKIALYNYKLDKPFIIDGYSTSTQKTIINVALRGAYQFYTYIKNENLDFKFLFVDLNRNKDSDRIDINLYYDDSLIDTRHLDDDGNNADDKKESETREIDFKVSNLPEGVYKLELRANDDIVTKKIETKQKIISFVNKVDIFKAGNEEIKLYTDSKKIEATTIYPSNLQTIRAGDREMVIDETYKQFSSVLDPSVASSSLKEIILEKDGLIVSGNGMFSFSPKSFLNPKSQKIDENLGLTNNNLKYILAKYKEPKKINTWNYSEIEIDLSKAYRENRNYSFIISIPGLKIDGFKDYVEIRKIKVELEGDNLLKLLREKLKIKK